MEKYKQQREEAEEK